MGIIRCNGAHADQQVTETKGDDTCAEMTLSPIAIHRSKCIGSPLAMSADCLVSHGIAPTLPPTLPLDGLGDLDPQGEEPLWRSALVGSAHGNGEDLWRSVLVGRPAVPISSSHDQQNTPLRPSQSCSSAHFSRPSSPVDSHASTAMTSYPELRSVC